MKKVYPNVSYVIGDVREGINIIFDKIDILYHVAAMKHIDVVEENIMEALKTNISGTFLAANFAMQNKIPVFAFASTDKAVFPINVYGYSKAICESHLRRLNKVQSDTNFRIFRWGNVLGSRGSVVEIFKNSLLKNETVNITHPEMTRFWIKLSDAVDFMVKNSESEKKPKGVLIPKMKSASVINLAIEIAAKIGVKNICPVITNMRAGEKIHENITRIRSSADSERYTICELQEMLEGLL